MKTTNDGTRNSKRPPATHLSHLLAAAAVLLTLGTPCTGACCMGTGGTVDSGVGGMGMAMGGIATPAATNGIVDTVRFAPAATCSGCHNSLSDTQGRDVSIHADWEGTVMANSGRDPIWQAKVNSEVLRLPQLRHAVEERCARCHTAMARVEARATGGEILLTGSGFFNAANPYHSLAYESVSCTMCHQILPGADARSESTGNYPFDDATQRPQRQLFGPFADPFAMPMERMAAYTPSGSDHMEDSALCGHCHTLYVPFVDGNGNIAGESPEQTPYLEWQVSLYARKGTPEYRPCQGCHLPHNTAPAWAASMPRHLAPRDNFALHHLVGGNVFLLSLLEKQGADFDATAPPNSFALTRQRTERMLQERTATVAIEAPRLGTDFIDIPVKVTNLSGHKFPTGVPARRAWLHVTVQDATGAVIFESGRSRPDGSISGNAADDDLTTFEPHYNLITSPDQVQIYEMVMGDFAEHVTYTFVKAKDHLKDNRLLPAGFPKEHAPDDIRVHGAASADPDFTGGSDRIIYRVAAGNRKGPLRITAELLYQPVSFAFMQDLLLLKGKNDAINTLDNAVQATPLKTVVVASATTTL